MYIEFFTRDNFDNLTLEEIRAIVSKIPNKFIVGDKKLTLTKEDPDPDDISDEERGHPNYACSFSWEGPRYNKTSGRIERCENGLLWMMAVPSDPVEDPSSVQEFVAMEIEYDIEHAFEKTKPATEIRSAA